MDKTFETAIHRLAREQSASFFLGDYEILVHILEGGKLQLSTIVYQGSGYLPKRVREAMHHRFPYPPQILTHLHLDEESHSISLLYLGSLEGLQKREFRTLLETFAGAADLWRTWFDDHDYKDRIHVPKNRP